MQYTMFIVSIPISFSSPVPIFVLSLPYSASNSIGQLQLSSCQREKRRGDLSRKPYRFVIKCKSSGEYESLQCWPTVGLCWCVNEKGKELLGSRMYFPWKPNCEQIGKFMCLSTLPSMNKTWYVYQGHMQVQYTDFRL